MNKLEITEEQLEHLRSLRGCVASVITGPIMSPQHAHHLSNMRDFCSKMGLQVEWRQFNGTFVSLGREQSAIHALKEEYEFLLMIDADAAPFPQDTLVRLLTRLAFQTPENTVAVGAYSQLKSPPHLPTIDTGTGTWEPHFPGAGLIEVMRTGGHCLLINVPFLRRIPRPWFDPKRQQNALTLMQLFDNYCRRNLDNRNPFTGMEEYQSLLQIAKEEEQRRLESGDPMNFIGEDSAFCDRVKAAGGRIFVDSDLVVGHVDSKTIKPSDLKEELDRAEKKKAAVCGVLLD